MALSEDSLISRLKGAHTRDRRVRRSVRLGIGDDAALMRTRVGYEVILTCDWFLEGSHFIRDKHPADSVGWKCLARALSDIAAMGGSPKCFLLNLALPVTCTGRWLDEFLVGLHRAARKFECPLVGGDTTCSRHILVGITVVGEIAKDRAVLRSGARPGDLLFVSGSLGQAELGLAELRAIKSRPKSLSLAKSPAARLNAALQRHLYPEPRLALGRWLAHNRLATAMMDLSDGLSTDLPRLCSASRTGAEVHADKILCPAAPTHRSSSARSIDRLRLSLHGGDDYELLFTVSPAHRTRIPASFHGVPLTQIGQTTRSREIVLSLPGDHKKLLRPGGWDPFR